MSIYRIRTGMGRLGRIFVFGSLAVVFLIGAVGYFSGGFGGGKSEHYSDKGSEVIAKINGAELTKSQYENAWNAAVEQARRQGPLSSLQSAQMRASMFQQMVNMQLLVSTAASMKVDISDRNVNAQIDKIVVEQLKQSRKAVLGDISKKQEKLDPRKDKEYTASLADSGLSIKTLEQDIRDKIPADQVRAEIAQEGIYKIIQEKAGQVSDKDITASYNVYKIRQIILMLGKTPKDQLESSAKKIVDEAKAGADFAKLANKYSDGPDKVNGGQAVYSFDSSFMFPPNVRKAIEKMKAGDISNPVKTDYGYYIIKLENVSAKLPGKLDSKTKAERRKAIVKEREYSEMMALQSQIKKAQKIEILDSELLGYWNMYKANEEFANPEKRSELLNVAIEALKSARKEGGNPSASVILALLLDQQDKTNEAIQILYPMLEGQGASVEGADLRIYLGNMLMKSADKDAKTKALQQYQTASEIAGMRDMGIHQQLIERFKAIGQPELAANEQKIIDDYQKQMAEFQARQKEAAKSNAKPVKPGK